MALIPEVADAIEAVKAELRTEAQQGLTQLNERVTRLRGRVHELEMHRVDTDTKLETLRLAVNLLASGVKLEGLDPTHTHGQDVPEKLNEAMKAIKAALEAKGITVDRIEAHAVKPELKKTCQYCGDPMCPESK